MLVAAGVDAIVTGGYPRARVVQQATRTIPILIVADDLVLSGLVPSLAHPGGNTTGISILATELDGKRQELLTELVPAARHNAKAIAAWFDRRGLALGIAMGGVGLGGFVMPQLAEALIERFTWRGAYLGLALLTAVVAVPAVALWPPTSGPNRNPLPTTFAMRFALRRSPKAGSVCRPGVPSKGRIALELASRLTAEFKLAARMANVGCVVGQRV